MSHRSDARSVALVTGASSGIGATHAERLASSGHDVVLITRRADRFEALAQRLRKQHGVSARVLIADLSEESGIDAVTSSIQSESELAVLVNDAGFSGMARSSRSRPTHRPPDRDHCRATKPLTRAALPDIVSSGRGDRCSTTPLHRA